MRHKIKIEKQFADEIFLGNKTFEIRNNDRGYQKGDYIIFDVVDDLGISIFHEISDKKYIITYVLSGCGLKENYVVFSFCET